MKISFDGLPGCRKHEIFSAINKRFGLTFQSSFDSEWHQRFLSDPTKYSLAYELNRLMSFYQQSDLFLNIHTEQPLINSDFKDYDEDNSDISDSEYSDEITDLNNLDEDDILNESPEKKTFSSNNLLITTTTTVVNKPTKTKKILYDSLYSLKKVYIEFLLHQGWLNKAEYDIFMKYYYLLYTPPDVIIYFYGTFENVFNRMKQMSHNNQLVIYNYSEEEFKRLHYSFEWAFNNNNCRIPIFKINVDDDLDVILNNIHAVLNKIDIVFKY